MNVTTNIMGNEHAYQFIIGNTKLPFFYMPYENPNVMEITNKKEFNRTQTIGGQAFEHWGEQPAMMHISMRIRKNSYSGNIIGLYNDKKYDLEDPMFCTELEVMQMMYKMDRHKLRWNITDTKMLGGSGIENKEVGGQNSVLSVATGAVGNVVTPGKILNKSSFTFTQKSDILSGTAVTSQEKSTNWLDSLSDTIIIFKNEIYSGFFTNYKVTEDGSFPFCNVVTFDFLITHTLRDFMYEGLANGSVGRYVIAGIGLATTATTAGYIVDSLSAGTQSIIDGIL